MLLENSGVAFGSKASEVLPCQNCHRCTNLFNPRIPGSSTAYRVSRLSLLEGIVGMVGLDSQL